MTKYLVILPIAGSISCFVEAVNEKTAIKQALNKHWLTKIETTADFELEDVNSFEALFTGSVSNVDVAEAWAEEQEPDDE